jgi:hypothetical protein
MPDRKRVGGTGDDPTVQYLKIIPIPYGEDSEWVKPELGLESFEVKLDGFPRSERRDGEWLVAFGFNEIAKAEKITGLNLLQGIGGFLSSTASATEYVGLLFAGLMKAHPKVTTDQVSKMLRIDQLQDIRRVLVSAFNLSLPEKKRMTFTVVPEGEDDVPNDSQTANSGNNAGPPPESTSGSPTTNSTP